MMALLLIQIQISAVVVVEGHSAKSVAFASATVSFVNLDITPK